MATKNKSTKRKDAKGRILHTGEGQRSDGRYYYKAIDPVTKKSVIIYSWRLEEHDTIPTGKRKDKPLREKKKELMMKSFIGVSLDGSGMTVSQLVDRYIETRKDVKKSTKTGYETVRNHLKADPFGGVRIDKVTVMAAKEWLIKLQDNGKSYSSIHQIRGVVRPAFQLATDSKFIQSNPFEFELKGVLINDSVRREAVTPEVERRFLDFLRDDKTYSAIYDGAAILFNTGMRISELCGLTINDVNMQSGTIDVNHQLQYIKGEGKVIVDSTKTEAGTRLLPMNKQAYEAFERIINSKSYEKCNEEIDGFKEFLFTNKMGGVTPAYWWEQKFNAAVRKHNSIYKQELPNITPHTCRHTYCTKMASSGIGLLTLQKLMGHADIQTTINVYTHLGIDYIMENVRRVEDLAVPKVNVDNYDNVIVLEDYI